MKRFVVATGGTGGHIYPALMLARRLKAQGHAVLVAGAIGRVAPQLATEGMEHAVIASKGLTSKTPWGIVSFSWAMMGAVVSAHKILASVKPDAVVGFGGYGSFPIVFAAFMRRIPTMIHEQNAVPGKANRLLGHLVKCVAVTFDVTRAYFPLGKSVWTGCPANTAAVAQSREAWVRAQGLDPAKPVVLVLGGSQGSEALNKIVAATVELLANQAQFIHMTGPKDAEKFQLFYTGRNLPAKAVPFVSPIEPAYASSDVVLARAGAATVVELAHFQKKAVLVPYPHAGGHQAYNADILATAAGAVVLAQKDAAPERLAAIITESLTHAPAPDAGHIRRYFPDDPVALLAQALVDL